jgi:hypothetical protein
MKNSIPFIALYIKQKRMKTLLLFSLFIVSISFAQNNCNYSEKEIVSIFKLINKSDTSNIKHPEVRRNDFFQNFDTIIRIMNCSDFEIQSGNYSKREKRKIEDGISRTLIHIFQSAPEKILNDSTIDLFKKQLEISNMKKKTLLNALTIYKYDNSNEFGSLKSYYSKALEEWDISEEELYY